MSSKMKLKNILTPPNFFASRFLSSRHFFSFVCYNKVMTNQEIAEIFREVADLLEITKKGNSFEIRAYQIGAEKIENLGFSLEELIKNGEDLPKIEGIGKTLNANIIELIKTGKLTKLKALQKLVPPAELELLKIPGIGPSLARRIFQILQIKSIDGLKKKLSEKSALEKLAQNSIKEATVKKILSSIDFIKTSGGRMLLGAAEPVVGNVVSFLQKQNGVKKVDAVGSYRRRKETVGDIDVIACLEENSDSEKLVNAFCGAPFAKKIIVQGENKGSIIDQNNIQIDLEIMPEEEYGSLLQHFTGSKEHNIALRKLALSKGLSFSEHGFKKIKNGNSFSVKKTLETGRSNIKPDIYCQKEEQVYSTLKMEYIPPELRENQGEIEAALKNELPRLVEYTDIKGDLQMHTVYSDGGETIEKMAGEARRLGYQYIAITDHSQSLGVAHGIGEKEILKQFTEIDKINARLLPHFQILKGIEVNILANGNLDLPDNVLEKFDIVVASLHSSLNAPKEKITARLIKAMQNPHIDIIGHPSGRLINERPESNFDWPEVFVAAKKYGKILEINASPFRLDLKDIYIREAIRNGVKLSLGTDAHSLSELGNLHYGVSQARRGWAEKKDIINCLSLAEFKKYLKIK